MEDVLFSYNPWWTGYFKTDTIPRKGYVDTLLSEKNEKDIVLISGIRRVGKTVLMHQTIERLLETVPKETILYVSLDHPIFIKGTILDIVKEHRRVHGLGRDRRLFLFLDEVHLKEGFERDLKVLHDMENVKIYASGSSSLLLRQKGAFLTGRFTKMVIRPLDFNEFLEFRGKRIKRSETYLYQKELDDYLRTGGMPEYVLRPDRPQHLLNLVESIIDKDIVAHYGVKKPGLLRELLLLLAERVGKRMTYNKLAKVLGLTPDTVKQYVDYLEETYLVRTVPRYARSMNERIYSPKKVYMADTGLKTVLTGAKETGPLAENLVFLQLEKRGSVSYYHEFNREIDFIVNGMAVEVKYKDVLDEEDTKVIRNATFRKKMLITKTEQEVPGVTTIPLAEFLKKG